MLTFVAAECPQRTGISTVRNPDALARYNNSGSKPKRSTALLLENDAALFTAECFEAALRIAQRPTQMTRTILLKRRQQIRGKRVS